MAGAAADATMCVFGISALRKHHMVRIFQTKNTFSQSHSSQTNETNDFVVTREPRERKVFTFSRSSMEKSRPCGLGFVYLGSGKGLNTFAFPFVFGFVVLCGLPFQTAR